MTRGIRLAAATIGLIALAGATSLAGPAPTDQRGSFRAEVVDRATHRVRVPAGGTLVLTNMVGDIEVRAGTGPEVRVDVVRVARGRTDADARQGLAGVTVHLAERGRRVTVEATHERVRNPPYAVTVSYAVTAPAATSVTIQSLTGHVEASGITGELSVDTTTGDVEIRDAPRLSRARTVTGSIDLTNVAHDSALEAGTIAGPVTATGIRTRRLRLDTVTGGITARDATADRVEIFTTQGSLTYDGAVAADGRYEMRTHSGSIRFIARSGSGFELRAQTFSGQIETARELGLTLVSRSRRELVGSVGDGRAVVLLTTFSGQVSVGRQ